LKRAKRSAAAVVSTTDGQKIQSARGRFNFWIVVTEENPKELRSNGKKNFTYKSKKCACLANSKFAKFKV